MSIRPEIVPFIIAAFCVGGGVSLLCRLWRPLRKRALGVGLVVALVLSGYFLVFFRDPVRLPPDDDAAIVAAAEGVVARIVTLDADTCRDLVRRSGLDDERMVRLERLFAGDVLRISIFLSLFDVHVNRAPFGGRSSFLGYFPGKHFFTFHDKSSEENQHNAILIENENTLCLVYQIVGPVCRRVVYWPDHERAVELQTGDKIGMMKFGSRLDMYLPAADVELVATEGQRVRAGETVVARLAARERP